MRKNEEDQKFALNQQKQESTSHKSQKSDNPWAIGTKFSKQPIKQDAQKIFKETQYRDEGDNGTGKFQKQPPQKRSSQYSDSINSSDQSSQNNLRHIPKLKERNPFSVLKQLQQDQQIDKLISEVKGLLANFNIQSYSIAEFMSELYKIIDQNILSSFEIVEFILSQVKVKDYFKDLNANQTTKIVNSLLSSFKSNQQSQNKESCIKLLGHVLFEQNEVDNLCIQKIYQAIQKPCFDAPPPTLNLQQQQQQSTGGSGSSIQISSNHKTQRLAMNCMANLLSRQSQFLKENCEIIFQKLKNIFEQHMRKIEQNFKSKRFISMLTTIIRALQYSMVENPKIQAINDTECIKLYINFYKILYLGTPFAQKMLNIKLEEAKTKKIGKNLGNSTAKINHQNDYQHDEEELKGDSGSFIIDTSEMSSSDGGLGEGLPLKGGKSPSSNDSITSSDPYQKIKYHAALCLQIMLKFKNKSLFNYWYLLFPSFFLRSPTEFSPYLSTFPNSKTDYFSKLAINVSREPSLFYLLNQKDNSTKFKQTLCFIINALLENSMIQKWQDQLENKDSYSQQQLSQPSFVSISSYLGQFLRYLHYQLIFMIDSEKDPRMIQQYVKVIGSLIQTTPYAKMNKNLASVLIEQLLKINQMCQQSSYLNEIDQLLRQQVYVSLTQAINNIELREEFSRNFLSDKTFIQQLIKIDRKNEFSYQTKDQYDHFSLIQKICKNFPQKILDIYTSDFHEYLSFHIQKSDRKRICLVLNIMEEWLKNFKTQTVDPNDDETAIQEEDGLKAQDMLSQDKIQQISPCQIKEFRDLLRGIIKYNLLGKDAQFSDVNISILSLLCNLDQSQWYQIFDDRLTSDILTFIEHVKHPPLLKAASLKLLGYLVYFDNLFADNNFKSKTYQMIFDSSNDQNQNIQIRNSWALANICCQDIKVEDTYILREVLMSSISYSVSIKEKVSSNGIRALGYFLRNLNIDYFTKEVLKEINSSPQLTQRICQCLGIKSKSLTLDNILMVIINNLDNKSPKISWNSSVALANLLENSSFNQIEILYSRQTINPLLNALTNRPNFKIKIHAAQTLLKFININAFSDKQLVFKFWETMLNSIEYINSVIYNPNDAKYLQNLEWNILSVWEQLADLSMNQDDNQTIQQVRQYIQTIGEFISLNSLALLQILTSYLRKELKIPQYSGMYDEALIKSESEQLFNENPQLEIKIEKLKTVIKAIREIIKNSEEVHVSFGVFEAFNSLAESEVNQYRSLECLKGIKSSFDPTFEESKNNSETESVESDKSNIA